MLLIIDISNMAYRAVFSLALSNQGRDTSVTFGVIKMITSLVKVHHPRYVIACFDGGTPYYRRRILPQYKTGRKKSADIDWDGVYRQIDELYTTALPIHGILTVMAHKAEADDLMAQAAQIALDRPYIVTADEDLLQCVDMRTSVINPVKGKIYGYYNMKAEVGVTPDRYLLYKMLVGDSSDNIPGVSGIGPITAEKLIRELHNRPDIDDLYDYQELIQILPSLKSLNKKQRSALRELGEDTWWDYYDVMDLSRDRCGARTALLNAAKGWEAADGKAVRRYYMANGFVSLLEDRNSRHYATLSKPPLDDKIRCPAPDVIRKAPC